MINNKSVNVIITARMGSSRLKGKALLPLKGKPALQWIIERIRMSLYVDDIIVAMPDTSLNKPIEDLCIKLDCIYFKGSEDNVLDRFYKATKNFESDIIVDITGDCPCVDYKLLDDFLLLFDNNESEYASNVIDRTFPRGIDIQIFTKEALEKVYNEVDNKIDQQHVTSWMYLNPKSYTKFKKHSFMDNNKTDFKNVRLTLDTEEDYELLCLLYEVLPNNFTTGNIFAYYKILPDMFKINSHVEQKNYYKELAKEYATNQIES